MVVGKQQAHTYKCFPQGRLDRIPCLFKDHEQQGREDSVRSLCESQRNCCQTQQTQVNYPGSQGRLTGSCALLPNERKRKNETS